MVAGDDIEIKAHRGDIGKKGNGTVTWPKAFIEGSFGVALGKKVDPGIELDLSFALEQRSTYFF